MSEILIEAVDTAVGTFVTIGWGLFHWISFTIVVSSISIAVSAMEIPLREGHPFPLYGAALVLVVYYSRRFGRSVIRDLE